MRRIKKMLLFLCVLLLGLGLWRNLAGRGSGFTVVLDPGHGGDAPGAVYEGVLEKDLNLAVALKVQALLSGEEDLRVVMTRDEDVDISLRERSELANRKGADLFISIHSNALENDTTYEGILAIYHQSNDGGDRLAEAVEACVVAETGGRSLGTRAEDFAVVRETTAPACLVEMGFMTSPSELARLMDEAYQTQVAQGIVDGILAYRAQIS